MHNIENLSNDIFWVGVNDRKTQRFENYIPLDKGVSYNSYLILDEKVALIDTVEVGTSENFLEKVEGVLDGRNIDYLIINHMEPDHSGAIKDIIRLYPDITLVGNAKTFPMLDAFYDCSKEHCDNNRLVIKEGDSLELGNHTLTFTMVPMVHWPESMVTFETTTGTLFSNDAFGSFGSLDGGIFDDQLNLNFYEDEMRRYYSNIVGKYGAPTQAAMKKLGGLDIKCIAPCHGPIWRTEISRILDHYNSWSKLEPEAEGVVIVYGSMYGNTEKMANAVARQLSKEGIIDIKLYDASKTDHSYIISDIWKYQGLIIGSCSHNNAVYPKVQPLLSKLQNYGLKNRYLGIFGNMMWSGGGVRGIQAFADSLKGVEMVKESVEVKGTPTSEDYTKLEAIATAMANKLKEARK